VSATMVSLLAILVPWSKPHVCPSPLLVYRHGKSLLDLHHVYRPSPSSTPAHQHSQETCCTCTHVMVSFQTQPKSIISDNHSSQTRHTRAYINLVFAETKPEKSYQTVVCIIIYPLDIPSCRAKLIPSRGNFNGLKIKNI
jgi:hypothetical protein